MVASNKLYTVDNLVTSLKLRGLPPSSQNTFTTNDFIQIISEEMQSHIVPLMDTVSEENFVTNFDIAWDGITTVYAIPPRAVGNKLRDVVFVDTSGQEVNLPRIRPEDIKTRSQFIRYQPAPWGYFLRDENVVLFLGTATQVQPQYPTLRLKYFRRPNILTVASNTGQITTIAGSNVTVDNVNPSWTTSGSFDIIKGIPNFSTRGDDLSISAIVGSVLTFSSLPAGAVIGDWVATANYSPIPQIPVEAQLLLAQYATAKMLEALGDIQGMQAALQKAEVLKDRFLQIITPRVEGSTIKLASRSGIGDWGENLGWW